VKESDDTFDVKSLVASRVVNWEQHESAPCGARLLAAQPAAADAKGASAPQSSGFGKLGCVALSVGAQSSEEMHTAAWSVQHALDPAFRFFKFVQGQQGQESPKRTPRTKQQQQKQQQRLQLRPPLLLWACFSQQLSKSVFNWTQLPLLGQSTRLELPRLLPQARKTWLLRLRRAMAARLLGMHRAEVGSRGCSSA